MEKRLLWVASGILAVLAIGVVAVSFMTPSSFSGVRYEPARAAYDFELQSAGSTPTRLSDLRGKLVLVFFGYTNCVDICPNTLGQLQQIKMDLGSAGNSLQVVFITVDPDRDTAERIQNYAARFDPSFIGLSGAMGALQETWDAYGVTRQIDNPSGSKTNYGVTHSTRLYLVDASGLLIASFANDTPLADLERDIKSELPAK